MAPPGSELHASCDPITWRRRRHGGRRGGSRGPARRARPCRRRWPWRRTRARPTSPARARCPPRATRSSPSAAASSASRRGRRLARACNQASNGNDGNSNQKMALTHLAGMEVLERVRHHQRRGAVVDAVLADRVGRELWVGHQVDAGLGLPLLLIPQLVTNKPHLQCQIRVTLLL